MINPEQFLTRSQDLEECFHDAGQFYWAKASSWASRKSIFEGKVAGILLPRSRVQDIDTPEDWELAEIMFRTLGLG
jgi:N-acylneuraminate cytidylyltransferase